MAKTKRKRLLAQRQKDLTSGIEVPLWRTETELLKALAIQRNGHPNLESYLRDIVVHYMKANQPPMSFGSGKTHVACSPIIHALLRRSLHPKKCATVQPRAN